MRLQHKCFPVKFAKFLRIPFFTEQLQWLLLTFNSYFLSLEQKPLRLSAINARFSSKIIFCHENQYLSEEDNSWIFFILLFWYPKFSEFPYDEMVLSCRMFCQDTFIIKKLFYKVVQTSSEMSSFLHCEDGSVSLKCAESVSLIQMLK